MTFDDDAIKLEGVAPHGVQGWRFKWFTCEALGLSWPPPERLHLLEHTWVLRSHSSITDDQRRSTNHVSRCALYTKANISDDMGAYQGYKAPKRT